MEIIDGILNLFKGILNSSKKVNLKKLPSQGLFYPDDFEIRIKKADLEDIIDYEYNFDKENIYLVVESLKKIVRNNTIISKPYHFEDLKSVDLVFLFLEIVKFTNNKKILIPYYNTKLSKKDMIEFGDINFNYFDFSKYEFDKETKEILIDGYRFTMPSIGVENCLTLYLANKIKEGFNVSDYFYDFIFFIGNKSYLSNEEIENLVIIFNIDMEDSENKILNGIVNRFIPIIGYSLKINDEIVDIKTKIDLETIWKDN